MRVDESLQTIDALVRRIVERSPDVIYRQRLTPEPVFEYLSPGVYALTGYHPEEFYANPGLWLECASPEFVEAVRATLSLTDAPTRTFIAPIRHANGSRVYVEARPTPIFDEAGTLVAVEGIARDVTERVRIETQLHDSERFVRRLTETTPGFIYIFDLVERRSVYLNRSLEKDLGYTSEQFEALGADAVPALIHPEDLPLVQQPVVSTTDELLSQEVRVRHADGSWRWFHLRGTVFDRDAAGQPRQILGLALDVTERKQAELALQESERFVRKIAETTPGFIYLFDLVEKRNLFVNQQLQRALGYTPEQFRTLGADLLPTIIHPDDLTRRLANIEERFKLADGEFVEMEYRFRHADGSWRWYNTRDTVFVRDAAGRPRQSLGLALDITARKQAELALQESERFVRQIAATTPSILYIYDVEQSRLVFANEHLREALGYLPAPPNTSGGSLRDLLHPDDLARVRDRLQRLQESPDGAILEDEFQVRRADGDWRWLHDRATVFGRDAAGQVRQLLGAARDITDQKQAEAERRRYLQQLVDLQEAERRYLAGELHDELGQTVTSLKRKLEDLRAAAPTTLAGPLAECDNLIAELLTRVRRLSLNLRPALLDELGLLSALSALFERVESQLGVRVHFLHSGLAARLPAAVETTAYRVIQEALTNAARHTREREVIVRLWQNALGLGLQVEDHGPGFDVAAAMKQAGTRGLPGMRERLWLLGGDLSVESELERGVTVTAHIPLKVSEAGATGPGA